MAFGLHFFRPCVVLPGRTRLTQIEHEYTKLVYDLLCIT